MVVLSKSKTMDLDTSPKTSNLCQICTKNISEVERSQMNRNEISYYAIYA